MNGAVDTSTSEQTLIGGVDDGVDTELRDVAADNGDLLVVRQVGGVERLRGGGEFAKLVEELNGRDIGDGGGSHFDGLTDWHRRFRGLG